MPSENINFSQFTTASKKLDLYDLHLSTSKHRTLPDLSELIGEVPTYLRPSWDNLIQTLDRKLVPGFMGLNCKSDLAAELLECIERAGGHGLVVPIGYLQPKITVEMAYPFAEQEVARRHALHLPNYKLEPTRFFGEHTMWWDFRANCPELIERDMIPGCVIVCVDKLDGRIWTSTDISHYLGGEEYLLESATILKPVDALELAAAQFGLEWGIDHKHDYKPCLKGLALVVGAVKTPSQNFIEGKFGLRPNISMWFRLNRHKKGYEAAKPLMMRIVTLLLEHDPADAILLFDDENGIVTVLKRISGQLIIDEKWSK